ncbi:MAG: cadmium-translocating P-type ATPase [Proteobacteria bacterium]|nr:cadmium-translocating P-type ATPase [Pseudomonadota bacterium]
MTCCAGPIVADCARENISAARYALLDEMKANARTLSDGSVNYSLSVPQIHCGNCITTIERGLGKLPGVKAVRANLSLRRVSVTLESMARSPLMIADGLDDLGYPAQPLSREEADAGDPELKMLIRAMAVAGFAFANVMLLSVSVWNGAENATRDLFHFVSALIAIPAVVYGGLPFFRSALSALKRRRMNMDVPISLGVSLATAMSLYESFQGGRHAYFDAATSLLFFLLIGRTLDHLMRSRARAAADRLARLSAKGGFVVGAAGETSYLPLAALQPGMIIRVAAGERFPVDGTVVEGESDVDRALVTGESDPQHLGRGTGVEAGTLNLTGSIDIRATRAAGDSFLAEVTRMMAAAERGRGTYERLADRMARLYSPVVHILALTSFLGWMIYTGGGWHQSLTVAVAVLIITCPCALGLAVPVAHVVASGRLFAAGILMKDGSALERMATVTDAVFDKTGTLTTGEPRVRHCAIPAGELSGIAKALASRSIHPAARALAAFIAVPAAINLQKLHEVPGHGVEADYNGRTVRLGRISWVQEIAAAGKNDEILSGVAFAVAGGPVYVTTLSEQVRPGARAMVASLEAQGLGLSVLSGDAEAQVASLARSIGIDHYEAGLKPGEKLARLKSMAEDGARALMVGDGLNDAPALAAAHVSMAPASASDIGRTAADFVFTRESLASVSFAHHAALATSRIVKQNFALAIIYNIFAVPLAMAGQLNPLIAAIAMSTSSIIVVGNSLRLYRLEMNETAAEDQASTRGMAPGRAAA